MEADKDSRPYPHHHLHRPTTPSSNNSSSSGTTGELFICFSTSRLSSSSMKISSSSKSILSPGRRASSRDQQPAQISLSTSLSRRLRTNGSIKGAGQASPMFPAGGGKKRGCAFENPEPSSPKVTCIGQVRVKTKKQGRKLRARSLSTRRPPTPGREGSFKRLERGISDGNASESLAAGGGMQFPQHECSQHRNQRWVHLPLTICEALRTFGSEFNCFLPCRSSSCLAGEESKDKEEKSAAAGGSESNGGGSCGTVFARWLVAVQERDVKGREIELVREQQERVEEEEDVYSSPEMRRRSYRRHHGFEEIDFDLKQEAFEGERGGNNGRDESRMSICIPPKNALLLMRCRSDPVKMAALGNKFWNPPDVVKDSDEAVEDADGGGDRGNDGVEEEDDAAIHQGKEEGFVNVVAEAVEMEETVVESDELGTDSKCDEEAMAEAHRHVEEESGADEETSSQVSAQEQDEAAVADGQETSSVLKLEEEEEAAAEEESAAMSIADEGIPIISDSTYEEISDLEKQSAEDNEEIMGVQANVAVGEDNGGEGTIMTEDPDSYPHSESPMAEGQVVVTEEAAQEPEPPGQVIENPDAAAAMQEEEDREQTKEGSEPENPTTEGPSPTGQKSKERESNNVPLLPDCLLLMMCEPKLSMEVSKETWVCSTDFIRWLPEPSRQVAVKKINGGDLPSKTVSAGPIPPQQPVNEAKMETSAQHQPPRSSCSYPAAQPMAWRPGAESIGSGLEMKLKSGGKAYELPLMLTRCKSEPRKVAAKLAPEACCWKNRKLEPHRLRIGAAGVGF